MVHCIMATQSQSEKTVAYWGAIFDDTCADTYGEGSVCEANDSPYIYDDANGCCSFPNVEFDASKPPKLCKDNIDNDGDGSVDCEDPECYMTYYCSGEDCYDEVDNNGDGLVDCDDPACAYAYICNF
jgi:hypothetical protein